MRRPLSIMRADAAARLDRGALQDRRARARAAGEQDAPAIASARSARSATASSRIRERPRTLLVGGGVGIPPMVFLAEALREHADVDWKPLVLMGSEVPSRFARDPRRSSCRACRTASIACMPLLDEWGVPSRLASLAGYPGCYDGYVTDLAAAWLGSLDRAALAEVEMFACGPTSMLKAAAAVARTLRHPLPGLAGGIHGLRRRRLRGLRGARRRRPSGPAMKRVCVDGPVFDAQAVFRGVSRPLSTGSGRQPEQTSVCCRLRLLGQRLC